MKQIYIIILSFLIISGVYSQQNPWYFSEYLESADTCDFSDTCGFIRIESGSQWEVGGTNKPFFSDNFTGSGLMTDTMDFYSDSDTSYFQVEFTGMLNYYDNFGGQALSVEFIHKMDSDTLKDGGFITVSLDSGNTWQNIADMDENPWGPDYESLIKHNIYSTSDTLFNGEKGYSGSFDWETSGVQIIFQHPVKSINTDPMIRFNFISDSDPSSKEGWIIDSLVIAEQYLGSSLDQHSQNDNFEVFPNPAQNTVYLKLLSENNGKLGKYLLIDPSGREVLSKISNEATTKIDVSGLNSGLYIIRWIGEKGRTVDRKVIVH